MSQPMISQQLYQIILPPHLRARVVLQVICGYHLQPKDVRIARIIVVSQMPHEGCVFITRHRRQERPRHGRWRRSVGYAAFSVTSSTEPASSPAQLAVDEQGFRSAFQALPETQQLLLEGGMLGRGLWHVCQVEGGRGLEHVYGLQNSRGATQPSIELSTRLGWSPCCTCIANRSRRTASSPKRGSLLGCSNLRAVKRWRTSSAPYLWWIRPQPTVERLCSLQERASLAWHMEMYCTACLIVRIGKAGDRLAYQPSRN